MPNTQLTYEQAQEEIRLLRQREAILEAQTGMSKRQQSDEARANAALEASRSNQARRDVEIADHSNQTVATSRVSLSNSAGRAKEAADWRNKTAARYDELMARHPEAFADHAAGFWLDAGDAGRARRLAQMNLEVRQTPRAHELLARAAAFGAVAPRCPINP